MKIFSSNLVIILCFIFHGEIQAQEIPEVLADNHLYSHSEEIINGTKWINEKKYRGTPFLTGRSWATGDVTFNEKLFENVQFNYDLYKNEFVLFVPEEGNKKFVVIPNKYLAGFSFTDSLSNQIRHFKYFQLPGKKEKQLYEMAYLGKNVSFLIKHKVAINSKVADGFLGNYIRSVDFFVKKGNTYESFTNKRTLLNILEKHRSETKKFIRENHLKIKKRHYEDIAPVIEYFDQLETQ